MRGLPELEAVLAVARTKGFRLAAAELGTSRTALSAQVASVEARLGVRLFNRTTRSVSLTEAGARFVAEVGPAVARIRGAMDSAKTARATLSGTLRINCSIGAAERITDLLVLPFVRRHPGVHVDLVTESRLIDIVAAGFDAGIRLADDVPRDMIAEPLGLEVRFVIAGTPKLLRSGPPIDKPADLLQYPCIRPRRPSGDIYRWELSRRGRHVAMDVRGPLTLDAPTVMRTAVREGVGLAYLPEWFIADELESGKLVRVLEDWTPSLGGLCLYHPSAQYVPPVLRAFLDMIRETRKKTPRSASGARPASR
ncbi:LysR family transcriptional regulator [Nannocystis sp. ILAH1]|uniref:LysR family transcriptional regulator n=1 Tax=unclassified Nannocystis TaxID=2627009 RepID=UPI0022713B52|nr:MULTISPECIES: LysR family transcriptional regulator [unclassified Nannocystis]MCY0986630.1 LysR family transcriptional regulator [Nannocystis sp. ILAH1]MCY1071511.1 LysR family transcriptional regulator [Nannocystis sp. RBIL2]